MRSYGPVHCLDYYDTHAIMCARYYKSCCIQPNCQMHFIARSQALKTLSRTLPFALNDTLPPCLTIRSQVSSQDALNHTPEDTLKYTPYCTRWHTPSLLDSTLPVSSQDTLKHTPEHALKYTPNLTWLYASMYAPGCSIQRLAELQVPGTGRRVAGGRWHMVAEIMTSHDIIVWTVSLARPPRQDLTMPHGHGVDNCSLRFCRKRR